MPWFKIDDNLGFHHKVVAAGNPAMGLWVRAGSVCAQQLTDGFVADHMAVALGTKAQAERLVSVGLWDRVKGGYKFHGWAERQPSKADVEAERAAAADRMRAYRERKRNATQKTPSQVSDSRSPERTHNEQGTNAEVRDVFADPDPTRPDPTNKDKRVAATESPKASGRKLPSTAFPENFEPNETNRALAAEKNLDLAAVVESFRDYNLSKDGRYADWQRALSTWLRREKANPAPKRTVRLAHASEIEQPPDGLSPDEYAKWDWEQRQKRAGA